MTSQPLIYDCRQKKLISNFHIFLPRGILQGTDTFFKNANDICSINLKSIGDEKNLLNLM